MYEPKLIHFTFEELYNLNKLYIWFILFILFFMRFFSESKTIQLQFYSLQPFPGDYPTKWDYKDYLFLKNDNDPLYICCYLFDDLHLLETFFLCK